MLEVDPEFAMKTDRLYGSRIQAYASNRLTIGDVVPQLVRKIWLAPEVSL